MVRFSLSQDSKISFRHLVHVPGNDHQYEDIQLLLCTPTKEEIIEKQARKNNVGEEVPDI